MPISAILLGLFILAAAAPVALQSADADLDGMFLIFLGIPVFLILSVIAVSRTMLARRRDRLKMRVLGIYSATVAVASSAVFGGVWRWLHPPNIRYEFSWGESSNWQEVQFTHTENGHEIQGPRVYAHPLRVRFPDLNHDGYPDIRVIGNGGDIAEYVYLPHNDGKCFWHLVKAKGFCLSYPPDGQEGAP